MSDTTPVEPTDNIPDAEQAVAAKPVRARRRTASTRTRGRSTLATTQGWVPTASGFDYLGDSYRLYRRRRVLLLGVIVFLVGACAILAARTSLTFWERSTLQADLEQAQQQQAQTSQQFRSLTGPGGIPVEQMLTQLDARRNAAVTIADGSPDVAGLLTSLSAINVPGVVITGVEVSTTTTTRDGQGRPNATPSLAPTPDLGASASPSAAAASSATTATVTISGTYTEQQSLELFSNAVRAITQLSSVDVQFASGTPGTLTITASLLPSNARGELIELELGAQEFSPVQPTPTPSSTPMPAPTGGVTP